MCLKSLLELRHVCRVYCEVKKKCLGALKDTSGHSDVCNKAVGLTAYKEPVETAEIF